ncbi:recombinase family protein [Pseudomonas putida]|uniref:recombinase family protein n=1 Tax=Pseudomonas TaxID=286 RepID=UPI0009F44341|nr:MULTISPECIES: recombinase family protein [Pseudomonas]MDD2067546.1 recombinase family protein [Pseudomonas putida]HDS1740212.1 recombinase family protein [Pseudomonas putida]
MPIAVPYSRFSSGRQSYGSSLHRQEALIANWLAHHPEYTLYERKYEDLGVSGSSGKHIDAGELGELLAAIEDGQLPTGTAVLVEAMDRFSRLEPMDTLNHLRTIVKAGIEFVTLDDWQRYDAKSLKGNGLLYLALKAQTAHEFAVRLSEFAVGSYKRRAEKAKLNEPIKRRNPFWLTSEGKLKDDGSSGAIKQVFQAFANGVPLRALAIQYSQYFANRQSLKHALRNPAAIGYWQRTTTIEVDGGQKRVPGELIKGVFDPAVTEELFYQVQRMLDDLADQPVTVARKFPLAGLMECGDCGANMVLLRQNARQQTDAVRCYRRMQSTEKCTNQKTIPVPVIGWFYEATRKPHAFKAYQRTKLPENTRQRIKLEGQIEQLSKQQARLRKLVLLDENDESAVADYQQLVNEKKLREQELASLPLVTDSPVVGMPEFWRFMHSDPFAISNLLQQDGYRIICRNDGTLEIKESADDNPADSAQYVGYARKYRMWKVKPRGEDTLLVDSAGQIQFPQHVTITTSEQWQQRIEGTDLSAYMDGDDLADYLESQG